MKALHSHLRFLSIRPAKISISQNPAACAPSPWSLRGLRRKVQPRLSAALAMAAALVFAGCVNMNQRPVQNGYNNAPRPNPQAANSDGISYWDGDRAQGSPAITINLREQVAYFYKGGVLVGRSAVSTGREGHGTSPGKFRITELDPDHASNLYGSYVDASGATVKSDVNTRNSSPPKGARYVGAPMPYFMRFDGATGMHAGFLPGYPASHGCIRMPLPMATAFFRSVAIGTPVTVQ